jgi:hypothetical protein
MRALQFWKAVTKDRSDFLDRLLSVFEGSGIRFCVIGGVAVNAYAESLVTLDFESAVAPADLGRVEELMSRQFDVRRSAHVLNVTAADSALRVEIQADQRYAPFVKSAQMVDVLGLRLPVAVVEDVLQEEIWAIDEGRRSRMGLLNVVRLIESYPELRERVPSHILARLVQ